MDCVYFLERLAVSSEPWGTFPEVGRFHEDKLRSYLNALEIGMEISQDQMLFGGFQYFVVSARPEKTFL